MKLHGYFARRFFWTFASIAGILALFQFLLDLIEELSRYGDTAGFYGVLGLTFLKLPEGMYQILPLVMILSSIALFMGMARSSELIVARAVGRHGLSALVGPTLVTLLIGGFIVSVMNPIIATTSKRYSELSESYETNTRSVLSIGKEGLWLRQGGEAGDAVIHAWRTNPDASILYRVSILSYDGTGAPKQQIVASNAQLGDGVWSLKQAKVWDLSIDSVAEQTAQTLSVYELPSDLTQDNIKDRFGKPSAIPIWELPDFITDLEQAGFSARRHIVWLHMEAAGPLFMIAMLLVGAGFTMRPTRMGRTGLSVLSAVLLGFGLYYVRNFAQIMGENGQIAPILAAWTPPIASILLATGILLHMEDG